MNKKPAEVTVGPEEYLQWCQRAKDGEVGIPSVVVIGNATFRLKLDWPATPPPKQEKLFDL